MNINKTKMTFALMGGVILIALAVTGLGFFSLTGGISSPEVGGGGMLQSAPSTSISNSYRYHDTWYYLEQIFSSLGLWIFLIVVVGAIMYFRNRNARTDSSGHTISQIHIPPFTGLFAGLLTLTLVILFARIWMDLENLVSAGSRSASAAEQLATLFAHMLFVLSLMASSFLIYFALHKTKSIYSVLVLPYLVVSVVFSVWLLIDTASFALTKLGNGGVYIVLFFVVGVFTGLLLLSQQWMKSDEKQIKA